MTNKLVSLRLTDKLVFEANKVTKEEGFASFQEFIKDAIRRAIREHQRRKDFAVLRALQGSAANRNIKVASKKKLEKAAKKLSNEDQDRLVEEFGLESVTLH